MQAEWLENLLSYAVTLPYSSCRVLVLPAVSPRPLLFALFFHTTVPNASYCMQSSNHWDREFGTAGSLKQVVFRLYRLLHFLIQVSEDNYVIKVQLNFLEWLLEDLLPFECSNLVTSNYSNMTQSQALRSEESILDWLHYLAGSY